MLTSKFFLLVLFIGVGIHCSLGKNITLNLLKDAYLQGAMCLDGSPPGYYMRAGSGNGTNKWVLHLMGGGWCTTLADCYNRSFTIFGSSKEWPESYELFGIFSDKPAVNPDFYNWNVVFMMYCDGGSFAGDKEKPDTYKGKQLHYRGYRNLKALIHHLNLEKGLNRATDVILTGCSAGGLAVYLHSDFIRTLIVKSANYKAFADAGYFLDIPDVHGSNEFPDSFSLLMKLQNIDEAIIPECKAEHTEGDKWRCLFAPYIYHYIKTPIFVLNSQYDAVVLNGSYGQPCMPPGCSAEDDALLKHYEDVFNQQVEPVLSSPSQNGYFLDSCYIHCQTFQDDKVWMHYAISGHTIARTFGDWYFKRSAEARLKDCENYPCNPTCPQK